MPTEEHHLANLAGRTIAERMIADDKIREVEAAKEFAQRTVAAILAKVGPVAFTAADLEAADPDDPLAIGVADDPTSIAGIALGSQHSLPGDRVKPGYAFMPVGPNDPPPDHVAYAEDANDRLLTRTGGQWRYVEPTTSERARARDWQTRWEQAGPLRPLLPALPLEV